MGGGTAHPHLQCAHPLRIEDERNHADASRCGPGGRTVQRDVERLQQELGPLDALRQKVFTNRMPRTEPLDDSYFRIDPRHLRFAGITLALWQAAKELSGRTEEHQREALRNILLHQRGSDDKPQDARRVLNEIDWFWPTHLSLTYRDADDRVSPRSIRNFSASWHLPTKSLPSHSAVSGPSSRLVLPTGSASPRSSKTHSPWYSEQGNRGHRQAGGWL